MKTDLYKNVRDLNAEQMEYLKFCLWYSEDGDNYFYDELSQEDKDIINSCKNWGDIPNEVVIRAYDDIAFCDEDFGISEEVNENA